MDNVFDLDSGSVTVEEDPAQARRRKRNMIKDSLKDTFSGLKLRKLN